LVQTRIICTLLEACYDLGNMVLESSIYCNLFLSSFSSGQKSTNGYYFIFVCGHALLLETSGSGCFFILNFVLYILCILHFGGHFSYGGHVIWFVTNWNLHT
jgi:hypothetical protein